MTAMTQASGVFKTWRTPVSNPGGNDSLVPFLIYSNVLSFIYHHSAVEKTEDNGINNPAFSYNCHF
jgi:hypothetical protein